jgi:hypothetical protein
LVFWRSSLKKVVLCSSQPSTSILGSVGHDILHFVLHVFLVVNVWKLS